MRVTCGNCSASFIAPDEKIRGRVAKYRCRKCGTTLLADGRGLGADVPDDPTEVMSAEALNRSDSLSARPPPRPQPRPSPPIPPVAAIPEAETATPPPLRVAPKPLPKKPVPRDTSASFQVTRAEAGDAPVARRRPPKPPSEKPAPLPPPTREAPREVTAGPPDALPSGLVDLQKLAEPQGDRDNGPPSSGRVNFDALLGDAPPQNMPETPGLDWSQTPAPLFPSIVPPPEPDAPTIPLPPIESARPAPTPRPAPSARAPSVKPVVAIARPPQTASIPPTARRSPVVLYVIGAGLLGAGLMFLMQSSTRAVAPAKPETTETRPSPPPTASAPPPVASVAVPPPVVTPPIATTETAPTPVVVDAGPPPDAGPPKVDKDAKPEKDAKADPKPEPEKKEAKPDEPKPDPKADKEKADKEKADREKAEKEKADKEKAEKDAKSSAAPAAEAGEFPKDAARAVMATAANNAASCKQEDGPVGPARVRVTFSTSGRSTQAIIDGPPFAGTAVGSCIASKFRGLTIPAFTGDLVTVTKIVTIQ